MSSTLSTVDQVSGKAFDFVVLGGGTAGLVVAARLSEDPEKEVLVLEAGDAHLDDPVTGEFFTVADVDRRFPTRKLTNSPVDLPGMFAKCLGNPEYDWQFTTVCIGAVADVGID